MIHHVLLIIIVIALCAQESVVNIIQQETTHRQMIHLFKMTLSLRAVSEEQVTS